MILSRLLRLPALSLSLGLLALPALALAAESGTVKKGAVAAQLVSDTAVIVPGQPFTVALRLRHDPHWHSYWIAAGTGYPTAITWTLPAGFLEANETTAAGAARETDEEAGAQTRSSATVTATSPSCSWR